MRDKKGRFSREDEEGFSITLKLPSLKELFYWSFIIFILVPWIIIGSKFNVLERITGIFEKLMKSNNKDKPEGSKKMDYFEVL